MKVPILHVIITIIPTDTVVTGGFDWKIQKDL